MPFHWIFNQSYYFCCYSTDPSKHSPVFFDGFSELSSTIRYEQPYQLLRKAFETSLVRHLLEKMPELANFKVHAQFLRNWLIFSYVTFLELHFFFYTSPTSPQRGERYQTCFGSQEKLQIWYFLISVLHSIQLTVICLLRGQKHHLGFQTQFWFKSHLTVYLLFRKSKYLAWVYTDNTQLYISASSNDRSHVDLVA